MEDLIVVEDSMPRTAPPPPSRRELRNTLRRLREQAGISAAAAARHIGVAQTTLTRYEKGRIDGIRPAYVESLCRFYGASPQLSARLQELTVTRRNNPPWWERYTTGFPPKALQTYLGLEDEASSLVEYGFLVPGLLQTAEYAWALFNQGSMAGDPEAMEKALEIRLNRQKILDRTGPRRPQLRALIDESTLLRLVGDAAVLRRQLEYLLAVTQRDNVTVQVMPLQIGASAGLTGGTFILLDFPEEDDTGAVFVDGHSWSMILDEEEDVRRYRRLLAQLDADALSVKETRNRIKRAVSEL